MDQVMMERLLAQMEARMKADKREMMAKMEANYEEMIKAITEGYRGAPEACSVKTEACLEKESAPEETEAVETSQEVPKGATAEEAIGVTEDRSRNLRLAVGCRGQLKPRAKHDGGFRQECAATAGRPTCRTIPVMHKGKLRRGQGRKCHRSGIKGLGKISGSKMTDRGLKK
jgi:hypothetical protein